MGQIRFYGGSDDEEPASPLYHLLIGELARDVEAGGVTARLLAGHERDPIGSALVLRLLAAVHRLVLRGRAPDLAAHYPSAGGRLGPEGVWPKFRAVLEDHIDLLRAEVDQPMQTNEVGRSAALVGGFLVVAQRFGLPLRVLEIGASAGLNLRWDHYRYEARGRTWGPADSPVRLCGYNTTQLPPFHVRARVTARRGCDPNPLDPTDDEDALKLMSFIWPDQLHRLRLLRNALEVARRVPATVDRAGAVDWLQRHLAEPTPGLATVVFHSIVMQYLSSDDREAVRAILAASARGASDQAPLAWLRFEPAGEHAAVHLTTWPDGDERLIARAGYHGAPVEWLLPTPRFRSK